MQFYAGAPLIDSNGFCQGSLCCGWHWLTLALTQINCCWHLSADTLAPGCRFRENPLVLGPPHVRFYAGAPLIDSNGFRLGSLCVLDHKPREFDAENCNVLCNFAEVVVREIEKDKRRVSPTC